jgi:hypothetical protein
MPNNIYPLLLTFTLFLLASAFLSVGSIVSYSLYAEDEDEDEDEDEEDYNSSTSLDQEMNQDQKCKIGVFGDSQASVPSTISGLCNQQGQNNVDSGSSLGGIGISMGP